VGIAVGAEHAPPPISGWRDHLSALEPITPISELCRLDKNGLRQLLAKVQARRRLLDDLACHLRKLADAP
jgi:hypothetical protein